MKRSIFLFLLLLTGITCFPQSVKKLKIDQLISYIDSSDHPLVVSFWATWCAPCVEEVPWLQAGVEKYKNEKVELVLVSLDFDSEYPAGLQSFIKKKNFIATFFWLDESNADYFCPKVDEKWSGGIPATLFINKTTGYRKFFERQLTDRQVEPEIRALVASAK
ncbi:TlpA disulfide reductase family protein [Pseudoflavitalea rhizosphaerae]|uniref:TlpA disulfide reductase family protein n=1 Tax=Pseudoflavitalea rhizosphaerae TaxID=1884793 RepID=UPI000F8CED42|nr:TlpA disulfide reductase family protein [Pseudoflavitalea rhizosphaerae]